MTSRRAGLNLSDRPRNAPPSPPIMWRRLLRPLSDVLSWPWTVDCGRVDSGQWTGGQWAVDRGQWTGGIQSSRGASTLRSALQHRPATAESCEEFLAVGFGSAVTEFGADFGSFAASLCPYMSVSETFIASNVDTWLFRLPNPPFQRLSLYEIPTTRCLGKGVSGPRLKTRQHSYNYVTAWPVCGLAMGQLCRVGGGVAPVPAPSAIITASHASSGPGVRPAVATKG